LEEIVRTLVAAEVCQQQFEGCSLTLEKLGGGVA